MTSSNCNSLPEASPQNAISLRDRVSHMNFRGHIQPLVVGNYADLCGMILKVPQALSTSSSRTTALG